MLKVSRAGILAAAIGVGTLIAGSAMAQTDGAALVEQRQDLMREMGRSFGPLVAILKGESTDFAAAATSAETINTNALRITAIFPEGTGRDAVPETRAKPEVWSERSTFEANAQKLAEESAKLVEVAGTKSPSGDFM